MTSMTQPTEHAPTEATRVMTFEDERFWEFVETDQLCMSCLGIGWIVAWTADDIDYECEKCEGTGHVLEKRYIGAPVRNGATNEQ